MPLLSADPKGYYALLGLDSKADRIAVKAAYRRRAKALHPDVNRRSDAIETFRRLTEAYRTLIDAERRPAYDAGANGPGWYESDGQPSPLHCSACGRLTAQPRYVVFERVTGQIFRTKIARIQGIFCRDCAQKQSIKASSATWALGWWSPTGPARTLKALWSNLKGGLLPKAENARLLIHQARAFLARGEADIARSLVVQARPFAAATAQMGEVEDLWRALAPGTRKLRNRWRLCSRAFALQLLPLAGLAVVLTVAGLIALVRLEADSAAADIKVMPVLQGETRYVAADDLKVREGASHATPMVALLDRFS
ncbi:MAG: J domain-containing protein, partial [Rhodospirillales bacterium]|nr:J domain-containing protein [Rhodospirillales bacterium]